MKRLLLIGLALLTAAGVGGFLVAASGVVPIKASAGHWAITEWMLQFGKRRSVATHTLGLELGDLRQRALVLKGAGHYHTGCRPCHGSPSLQAPRVARAMLPPPPYLPPRIASWDPDELFYLVKHGIKFTGMPAWPTQRRDDEVRAMVAFLLEFPRLGERAYDALVWGDVPPVPSAAELPALDPPEAALTLRAECARCHGMDGNGRDAPAFPKLAGQTVAYQVNALRAFAADRRHSGIMQPVAAGLDEAQVLGLSRYYARQKRTPARPDVSAEAARTRGERIAEQGIPEQRVPSCSDCHGPSGTRRRAAYPLLAGQDADYLVLQLELFKAGQRGGSEYAHLMRPVATRLKPEQMRDVAQYYASSSPAPPDP